MLHKLYIMYTTELYIYMKWLSNKGPYHPEKKTYKKWGTTLAESSPPGRILFVNESVRFVQRPGETWVVTLQLVGEINIGYFSQNCWLYICTLY